MTVTARTRDGAWRRERLRAARLYVVTGMRERQGDLAAFLDAVLRGGADIIQLREKEVEAAQLLRSGESFRDAARRHGALFIVNDRPDVALALDADGVHLGQADLPPAIARRVLGADALVGLSTHSREQVVSAAVEADYVCVGPVHATPTKPGRPATGIALIREAATLTQGVDEHRPWFAIGGLDTTTLAPVIAAGASRAVVVRAVDTDEPEVAARALRSLLDGTG